MDPKVTPLAIPDVLIILTPRFADDRGYFVVTYEAERFRRLGLPDFVQDNQAFSAKAGTIRGLHFQRAENAQAKLVRVLKGSIFDVAVDIRRGSASYGAWVSATLTAELSEQIFIPRGFAHGYCTLEDNTEIAYKCDAAYAPYAEAGVLFSDNDLAIEWPVTAAKAILSAKDRSLPPFRQIDL